METCPGKWLLVLGMPYKTRQDIETDRWTDKQKLITEKLQILRA